MVLIEDWSNMIFNKSEKECNYENIINLINIFVRVNNEKPTDLGLSIIAYNQLMDDFIVNHNANIKLDYKKRLETVCGLRVNCIFAWTSGFGVGIVNDFGNKYAPLLRKEKLWIS